MSRNRHDRISSRFFNGIQKIKKINFWLFVEMFHKRFLHFWILEDDVERDPDSDHGEDHRIKKSETGFPIGCRNRK